MVHAVLEVDAVLFDGERVGKGQQLDGLQNVGDFFGQAGGDICLSCGTEFSESIYCDECGEPMPADITQIAISDFDPDDYKKLCPECASKFASSDEYIDYTLN